MNFHVPFPDIQFTQKFHHQDDVFFLGSCFAENIGNQFQNLGFKSLINPWGILFSPSAIASFTDYLDSTKSVEEFIIESTARKGIYNHWHAHGKLFSNSYSELVELLNLKLHQVRQKLKESNAPWVVVSLGTAIVYQLIKHNILVANCHKMEAGLFKKILLDKDNIEFQLHRLIQNIRAINSKSKFIFTVSPVRYIREGLHENNLSKSTLLLAIHSIVENIENCFYFPSYEIVIDCLRDYRFFKEDMVHPSQQAIDIIFEKFTQSWLDSDSINVLKEVRKISAMKNHRIFYSNSEESIQHQLKIQQKETDLKNRFPHLHF